jgi:HEAT repeat protein
MKKPRTRWVVLVVLAVVVGLLVGPGSPVYLPDLLGLGGHYQGRPTRHWIQALKSHDAEDRQVAIHAIGVIGAQAGGAVPELAVILLEDPDRGARIEAALALMKLASSSREEMTEAVPALARALSEGEPVVRIDAAIALMRLRGAARPAIPALIKALRDGANQTNAGIFVFTIQEMSALALGQASAGSAEAVPALTEVLTAASTRGMRENVARALGEVGPEARPATTHLRALLKDGDFYVRRAAKEALEKIEGKPVPAP